MIDSSLSYCLMILVIISSLSVISTVHLPQKVMAHILPSEGTKVPGEDEANVHSGIPNQLMLVLAVTVIITVMVARVQQAVAVTDPGKFSRGREAGQSAGKNAAMSGMPFDTEAPSGNNFDWIAGYYVGYSEGYNTARNFQSIDRYPPDRNRKRM